MTIQQPRRAKAGAMARRGIARRARLDVRMTDESKEILLQAAALRNTNLSDFVLSSAQREAEQIIAAHHLMILSAHDSQAFAQALASPPAPTSKDIEDARVYLDLYHPTER